MSQTKYPLIKPLPGLTTEDINYAFDWMDEWEPIVDMVVFEMSMPQYSGGEQKILFESWVRAKGSTKDNES